MEFTFVDFNLHSGKKLGTPYLYTGITLLHMIIIILKWRANLQKAIQDWAYGIPMAIGYKTTF